MKVLRSSKLTVHGYSGGALDEVCTSGAVECEKCGCTYEYSLLDIKTRIYLGASPRARELGDFGYLHYLTCPECGDVVGIGATTHEDFPEKISEKCWDEWDDVPGIKDNYETT